MSYYTENMYIEEHTQDANTHTNTFSLYIPYVKVENDKRIVEETFEFMGCVSRVDFTPIKNFYTKEVNAFYKRAFIHFHSMNDCDKAVQFFDCIHQNEFAVMNFYDEYGNVSEFWKVYIAANPITETELNIHQLANNFNIIDDKVIDIEQNLYQQSVVMNQMEERNIQLEERVKFLEEENARMCDNFENLKTFVFEQLDLFNSKM